MKPIYLNSIEFYEPEHRTRKAYRHLINIRNQYLFNQINLTEFLDKTATIIFNEIAIKDLKYFKSVEGVYFTIFELLVQSIEKPTSLYRLKTDLLTIY